MPVLPPFTAPTVFMKPNNHANVEIRGVSVICATCKALQGHEMSITPRKVAVVIVTAVRALNPFNKFHSRNRYAVI
jgi:hypothetical protein